MSRRRKAAGEDSLDLLLDTVCNTFGSLIFLALLVSVLLSRTSRKPAPEQAGTRPAVSQADITQLRGKLGQAESTAREAQNLLEDYRTVVSRVSSEEILALLNERSELQRRADERETALAQLLMQTVETQAATAGERAAAVKARQEAARAANALTQAQARLEAARRERTRRTQALAESDAHAGVTAQATSAAPRERRTSKQEFGLLLRYGRMYLMHIHSGGARALNSEDFLIVTGGSSNEARARPAAGTQLAGADASAAIAARLRPYAKNTWYPCVIVHPDSFEEFQVLKRWLVSNGYEYRLMPTDSPVTDAGRVDARVQ